MLAPDSRALLLDALRPPRGSSLDRAVATTFTLDLEAALMVPLAFAGFIYLVFMVALGVPLPAGF